MLGPHSCQLQRDLKIRSGNNIIGQWQAGKGKLSQHLILSGKVLLGSGLEGKCTEKGFRGSSLYCQLGQTEEQLRGNRGI